MLGGNLVALIGVILVGVQLCFVFVKMNHIYLCSVRLEAEIDLFRLTKIVSCGWNGLAWFEGEKLCLAAQQAVSISWIM
jgi:hypothetical protein